MKITLGYTRLSVKGLKIHKAAYNIVSGLKCFLFLYSFVFVMEYYLIYQHSF